MINRVIDFEDLPIKEAGEWSSEELTNWLHPAHGPLPEVYCVAHSGEDHYVVALWLRPGFCITLLECPESPGGRGSILWSSRWPRDQSGRILAKDYVTVLSEIPVHYATTEEFLAAFLPAVIEDAEHTPLGEVATASQLRVHRKTNSTSRRT